MERNFKGQYYRVNEQEQDTMDDFTIDETLSYLNSKNNGHERKGNFWLQVTVKVKLCYDVF